MLIFLPKRDAGKIGEGRQEERSILAPAAAESEAAIFFLGRCMTAKPDGSPAEALHRGRAGFRS